MDYLILVRKTAESSKAVLVSLVGDKVVHECYVWILRGLFLWENALGRHSGFSG